MRMRVTPEKRGHLLIEHECLHSAPLARELRVQYEASAAVSRCSICERLHDGKEILGRHPDADTTTALLTNYAMCNECRVKLRMNC